jgi:hypothetical protein
LAHGHFSGNTAGDASSTTGLDPESLRRGDGAGAGKPAVTRSARRWLPLPRLGRGVTGIAGGLALGFQGDFLSRLLRFRGGLSGYLLGGLPDRFLM